MLFQNLFLSIVARYLTVLKCQFLFFGVLNRQVSIKINRLSASTLFRVFERITAFDIVARMGITTDRRSLPRPAFAPFATPTLEKEAPRTSSPVTSMAQSGVLPNISLTTHNNQTVNFYEDLVRGKAVLMHFFFNQSAEEPSAAAMVNLLKAQSLLGDKMGKDIFFLSITSQPLDTLTHYVQLFERKEGCKLLAGKPQDVYLLSKSLGFSGNNLVLRRDINHDAVVARFDDNGLKRWGMVSLGESPEHIANAFKGLGV